MWENIAVPSIYKEVHGVSTKGPQIARILCPKRIIFYDHKNFLWVLEIESWKIFGGIVLNGDPLYFQINKAVAVRQHAHFSWSLFKTDKQKMQTN